MFSSTSQPSPPNPRTPAPNKFAAKALHKAGALRDGDAKMKDLAAPKKDVARARSHRPKLINEIKGGAGAPRTVNIFTLVELFVVVYCCPLFFTFSSNHDHHAYYVSSYVI